MHTGKSHGNFGVHFLENVDLCLGIRVMEMLGNCTVTVPGDCYCVIDVVPVDNI